MKLDKQYTNDHVTYEMDPKIGLVQKWHTCQQTFLLETFKRNMHVLSQMAEYIDT